jgi:aspartyl/asparaginyl-tRNA synthetase
MSMQLIDPQKYNYAVNRLREFFHAKGFLETPVQHRLSILAACEDPRTISTFNYAGYCWPLPQTGQMWLEYELLKNPSKEGFFCISTSYRNEPNPIPNRHDLVFPMFEFEMPGNVNALKEMEKDLLEFLGFGTRDSFREFKYSEAANKYNVEELEAEHETKLWKDEGSVVFLSDFPEYTSPFWNMKRYNNGNTSAKVDVLLYGMETIGSAERSTDPVEMKDSFYSISDGIYADILHAHFGKERIKKELEEFLNLDFFERSGGGMGMTRVIRAMELAGLFN